MDVTKRDVFSFMDAVENGHPSLANVLPIAEELDPLLLYFVLRYLKDMHGKDKQGPGARLLQFLSDYPHIAKLAIAPKNEPMVEWFDDSYTVHSFKTRAEYIDLIIDKMEG